MQFILQVLLSGLNWWRVPLGLQVLRWQLGPVTS